MERRSTASTASSATPASWREISSRSLSSDSNRSSSLTISSVERRSAGSSSSLWSWIRSAAIRTVVSGVRSSWLTSEVKRRCRLPNSSSWVIWRCRLSAMSLNDTASRAMSSSPRTGIRSVRWPSANRSAIRDADRTGSTIWRATSSAIAASRPSSTTPPVAIVPRTSVMVRLLVVQREDQVQLEVGHRRRRRAADDQRRSGEAVGVHGRVLVADLSGLDEVAQRVRGSDRPGRPRWPRAGRRRGRRAPRRRRRRGRRRRRPCGRSACCGPAAGCCPASGSPHRRRFR